MSPYAVHQRRLAPLPTVTTICYTVTLAFVPPFRTRSILFGLDTRTEHRERYFRIPNYQYSPSIEALAFCYRRRNSTLYLCSWYYNTSLICLISVPNMSVATLSHLRNRRAAHQAQGSTNHVGLFEEWSGHSHPSFFALYSHHPRCSSRLPSTGPPAHSFDAWKDLAHAMGKSLLRTWVVCAGNDET